MLAVHTDGRQLGDGGTAGVNAPSGRCSLIVIAAEQLLA